MTRPARARLNVQALTHNLAQVRRYAPGAKVMAVVKADGYGHGLAWVAQSLEAAAVDAFGVACLEEGVALRAAGIVRPICVLEGFFHPEELLQFIQLGLDTVVHCEGQLRAMEACAFGSIDVWLKIDTGMHRLGFAPDAVANALDRLGACRAVRTIRLLSHLACADDTANPATRPQIESLRALRAGRTFEASLANSAGIVAWPDARFDWVRPGTMLHGCSPLLGRSAADLGLKPVMTLETALISVARRRQGDAVGYGGEWRCPTNMTVGVATIGYGDGYPRHAPPGTPVLVNGARAALIGRVSMDMITIDLSACPKASVGDRVILWGDGLPVEEIAQSAGTISYELLCHVTKRIPRVS